MEATESSELWYYSTSVRGVTTWTLLASVLCQMSPVHTLYNLSHFIDLDNILPPKQVPPTGSINSLQVSLQKIFTDFVFLPCLFHIPFRLIFLDLMLLMKSKNYAYHILKINVDNNTN